MKKLKLIAILVFTSALLTSCMSPEEREKFGGDVGPDGKPLPAKSESKIIEEVFEGDRFKEPRVYAGTATRSQFFCLDDCHECPATGPVAIKLEPDGRSTIEHTADCMKYGEKGCFTDGDKCLFAVSGGYSAGAGKINMVSCNESTYTAAGNAEFDDGQSNGNVTCTEEDGDIGMTMNWSDIRRVQ